MRTDQQQLDAHAHACAEKLPDATFGGEHSTEQVLAKVSEISSGAQLPPHVLVTGSLFLMGAMLPALGGRVSH